MLKASIKLKHNHVCLRILTGKKANTPDCRKITEHLGTTSKPWQMKKAPKSQTLICKMLIILFVLFIWHAPHSVVTVQLFWYNRLSLDGHLYKTDTSVKRTPRVGPCLSLLQSFIWLFIRRTLIAGPKGVRLRWSWLYLQFDCYRRQLWFKHAS